MDKNSQKTSLLNNDNKQHNDLAGDKPKHSTTVFHCLTGLLHKSQLPTLPFSRLRTGSDTKNQKNINAILYSSYLTAGLSYILPRQKKRIPLNLA